MAAGGVGGKSLIDSIYFGGGTASTLTIKQVTDILSTITSHFQTSTTVELSFEGECLTLGKPDYVEAISALGFTRLSFGVQVAHQGIRQGLNLRPSMQSLAALAERATPLFEDVCIDYIFGWPGFDLENQKADLKIVLDQLQVPTIELFRFEPLDASPAFIEKIADQLSLDFTFESYARTLRVCTEQLFNEGYSRKSYTVFSKLDAPTRANTKYYASYYGWEGRQLLGFGIGAQSFYDGLMWGNTAQLDTYWERLSEGLLSCDATQTYDPLEKELITWPRRGWISSELVETNSEPTYLSQVNGLIAEGLVIRSQDRLELSRDGWAYVPWMMQNFLRADDRRIYDDLSRYRAVERKLENHL